MTKKDSSQVKIDLLLDARYNSAYLDNSLIEKDITYQIFERNRKLIVDQVSEISDMCFSRNKTSNDTQDSNE